MDILIKWFKDNWNELSDETHRGFHNLLLHAGDSRSDAHCMYEIFFTYSEIDGSVLE